MAKEGTVAEVAVIPPCDFCKQISPNDALDAAFDGKTTQGPWANMCTTHYGLYGVGLGVGRGQRLVLAVKGEAEERQAFDCPQHGTRHPLIAHWECFPALMQIAAESQDPYA